MLTESTKLSTVRMQLFDYDAAPDGIGTYVKINQGFSSLDKALMFRAKFMANMYWGSIYDIYGNRILDLDEKY